MEKRKLKKKQVQVQRKVSAVDFMTKKFLNATDRPCLVASQEVKGRRKRKGSKRYKGKGARK